ncbi:btb kelch-domain containing protein [Volepox virus]|uniref:Btb kelch-domain containing protein n=1 Tax=Volepox virus TaxID=28874 RepID=A0A1C9KC49_9POXV|nr:btb kelch-domain containing protein [Volepox virus]AOP31696.1 btb kelch-domain containing protein [Volepox virus]
MYSYDFIEDDNRTSYEKELCMQHLYSQSNKMKKLMESNTFCDITFHTNDNMDINTHRVIVSGFSTYFAEMLRSSDKKIFNIDCSYSVLKLAIDYIYTGFMEPPKVEDINGLFNLIEIVDSDILGREVVSKVNYIMDNTNSLVIYEILNNVFKKTEDKYDAMNMAEETIAKNIDIWWKDPKFKQVISSNSMINIMNYDYISIIEDDIVGIIINWLTDFPKENNELISTIRWYHVSTTVREDCKNNPLFSNINIDELSKQYIGIRNSSGFYARY